MMENLIQSALEKKYWIDHSGKSFGVIKPIKDDLYVCFMFYKSNEPLLRYVQTVAMLFNTKSGEYNLMQTSPVHRYFPIKMIFCNQVVLMNKIHRGVLRRKMVQKFIERIISQDKDQSGMK